MAPATCHNRYRSYGRQINRFEGISITDKLFSLLTKTRPLYAGWHLTRRDVLKDFYLDDFGLECFAANLPSHIGDIARSLRLGEFRFAERRPISIPKGPYGTRPGSILSIRDRVVLWSIIALLAPKVDAQLRDGVRSFRIKKGAAKGEIFEEQEEIRIPFLKSSYITRNISPFSPWHYNWLEFDRLSKKAFSDGYKYLAITDISAYFENINLEILRDQLLNVYPDEQRTINLLMGALHGWAVETPTGSQPKRGIPQGTGISSFLGNMFLMPVDEALHSPVWQKDTVYLRYMDDIRVFCRTKTDAINALLTLEAGLRKIHLSVQSAKTKVIHGESIREILDDDRIDAIKKVRERFPTRSGSIRASRMLTRIGSKVAKGQSALSGKFESRDGLEERATRMWYNSLMYYGSSLYVPALVYVIIRNADPRYSETLIRTVKRFPDFTYPKASIYSFLDGPQNVFEYHECHIMEAFRYMNSGSKKMFERCLKTIQESKSYNLKLAATRYLAKYQLDKKQLQIVGECLSRESYIPCALNYLLLLAQQSPSDFALTINRIARIPSFQSVDLLEFVRKVRQFSGFTKSYLAFVFADGFRFRLADWIGVIWIMSHTTDSKLKRHLDGILRRRELVERDSVLLASIGQIRRRLR